MKQKLSIVSRALIEIYRAVFDMMDNKQQQQQTAVVLPVHSAVLLVGKILQVLLVHTGTLLLGKFMCSQD